MTTTASTQITEMSPAEIDTVLAELWGREAALRSQAQQLRDTAARQVQDAGRASSALYQARWTAQADKNYERAAELIAEAERVAAEAAPWHSEFTRRGGWTRAFLVVSSDGGHVHKNMNCSTCRITTGFHWVVRLSGAAEAEIVAAAGVRACTMCWPSAPTEVLTQPTTIFSDDEVRAQAAREARDEARAVKAAKDAAAAISMPDGSPLKYLWNETVRTERTAQTYAADALIHARFAANRDFADQLTSFVAAAVVALAHKRGVPAADVEADLVKRAQAKAKRDGWPAW